MWEVVDLVSVCVQEDEKLMTVSLFNVPPCLQPKKFPSSINGRSQLKGSISSTDDQPLFYKRRYTRNFYTKFVNILFALLFSLQQSLTFSCTNFSTPLIEVDLSSTVNLYGRLPVPLPFVTFWESLPGSILTVSLESEGRMLRDVYF